MTTYCRQYSKKRLQRHHLNPLIRFADPARYSLFLKEDCVKIDNYTHLRFHKLLNKDKMYAEAKKYIDNLIYSKIDMEPIDFDKDSRLRFYDRYFREQFYKFIKEIHNA